MSAVAERVEKAVAPLVSAAGMDLEGVEVQPAGRRRLVRVLVDRDGGIVLDDVAALSRALSEALDAADAMGDQPYVLEVSSPGVDRPLTLPRHWRRNQGRLVEAVTTDGRTVTGRVAEVVAEGAGEVVVLTGDDGQVRLPLAEVTSAHVQVEFNRPQEG